MIPETSVDTSSSANKLKSPIMLESHFFRFLKFLRILGFKRTSDKRRKPFYKVIDK